MKNDDPLTKQITELKGQVKLLTLELIKANQHIELLSAMCGQMPKKFGQGLLPNSLPTNPSTTSLPQMSPSSI